MNKKVIKKILSVALCGILAISITACGGGIGGTKDVNNGVPKGSQSLSSLLNQKKPVIFYHLREIDKDSKPRKMYYFENGRVTKFDNPDSMNKTMGELAQMKDEEIIQLAFEAEKIKNKENRQEYLDRANKDIEENRREKQPHRFRDDGKMDVEVNSKWSEFSFTQIDELLEFLTDFVNYDTPVFSSPFEIVIGTDASGNMMETESIYFANPNQMRINYSAAFNILGREMMLSIPYLIEVNGENDHWSGNVEIEADSFNGVRPIYDSFYNTILIDDEYLITRVENEESFITLDPVGTKGTVLEKPTDEFRNKVAEELAFRYAELKKNCPKITTLVGR